MTKMDDSRGLFEGTDAGERHRLNDAPSYVYEPLPKPDKESDHYIRLIVIKPGNDIEDIVCTLKPANIGLKPKYETLSYVWGQPERTAKVICNGKYLAITNTLLKAMRHLRLKDTDRVLWIDQLCINQDDIAERNSQVGIMNKIYQGSCSTTAFLDSEQGDQCYNRLEPSLHSLHLIRLLVLWDLRALFGPIFRYPEGDPSILFFREFFAHPWFSRIWIVQEFCVSQKVTFVFRNREIPMHTFILGSLLSAFLPTQVREYGSSNRQFLDSRVPIHEHMQHFVLLGLRFSVVLHTLTRSALQNSWTICDLLRETRLSQATNPRDKVFAIVTLLRYLRTTGHGKTAQTQPNDLSNIIDYADDISFVYRKVAEYIISTENSLQLLCYKEGVSKIPNNSSWVPDWSVQKLVPLNHLLLSKDRERGLGATRRANKNCRDQRVNCINSGPICRFDSKRGALLVQGCVLDTIAEVSSCWTKDPWGADEELYAEWAMLVTSGQAREIHTHIERRKKKPLRLPDYLPGHTSFNFWTRLGHSGRLRTTDEPFGSTNPSDHPLYTAWSQTAYRWRNRRTYSFLRPSMISFGLIYSWGPLSRLLPFSSVGRKLARTSDNYIALIPAEAKSEDIICYLDGGGVIPFVLREDEAGYRLIGACYVHGFFTPGTLWAASVKQEFIIY